MTGSVDAAGRALLIVSLRHPATGTTTDLTVWIDTGFTGDLIIPRTQLVSLGLPLGPTVYAVLADGSQIEVETYSCEIHWFGQWQTIEVLVSDGQLPLLGVGLLLGHDLVVSYTQNSVTLS